MGVDSTPDDVGADEDNTESETSGEDAAKPLLDVRGRSFSRRLNELRREPNRPLPERLRDGGVPVCTQEIFERCRR